MRLALPVLILALVSTADARQFSSQCHLTQPVGDPGHLLGSFTTRFKPGNHRRAANVRRAGLQLDGVVMRPHGRLSYNAVVGPRDAARGFAPAPVIYKGKMVDQAGGGACQPSSTLYAASLVAGMRVAERSEHTWVSTYIAPGLDATIVWGRKDLVLKNPYPFSVRLVVETGPGWITTRLVGTRPKRGWVEIDTKITVRRKHKVVVEVTEDMDPKGYLVGTFGIDGLSVARKRRFRRHEDVVRTVRTEPLSLDYYHSRNEVVLIGEDGT